MNTLEIKNEKSNNFKYIKNFFLSLFKNKWAFGSLIWLLIILNVAIFASKIVPHDPNRNNIIE
ncbi:uncharacterized protein METZ01_LOCUS202566, partial [marine metagenome]